jgi:hypothetical protein
LLWPTHKTPTTEAPPRMRPLDGTGILAGSCATSRTDSAVTIAAWRIDAVTGEKTTVHVALGTDGARLFAKQVNEWADHVDKLNGPPAAKLMRYVMDAAEKYGWRAEPQTAEKSYQAENSNEPVRRAEVIATVEPRSNHYNKQRGIRRRRARKAKRR